MGEPTFAERYAAFARFNPEHVKRRLDTLAHNLAVAGGLCAAYWQGIKHIRGQHWRPGCGRDAPGWTREEGR